jgi:diadenosine tetraphosphate (Ap4A) HIT family hydrolase
VLHGTINFVKKGHQLGIEDIVKKRSEYRKEDWNVFVERTRERCWLMGTSLSKWSEDAEFRRIVREKLQGINNYELRLLILDPNSEEAFYRNTQEDKTTNRIKRAIGNFQKNFGRIFKDNHASKDNDKTKIRGKAEIRLYRLPVSNSILIFDDELIVGHYLSSLPNKDAIALHLKKISGRDGGLFTQYSKHFEEVWDKAYKIQDYDDDESRSIRVVRNCRFCAYESYRDKNYIFYEDKFFYVMNSWGQMIDGYLLINTIEHVNSCSKISDDQIANFIKLKDKTKRVLSKVYPNRKFIFYEHGRSDYCKITDDDDDHCHHAHLHCVPVPICVDIHTRVQDESLCLVYRGSPSNEKSLKGAYKILNTEYSGPYIYIEQDDTFWIYCGTRNLRRQFLRWVLAKELNCGEEKACWLTGMEDDFGNELLTKQFEKIEKAFEEDKQVKNKTNEYS